MERIDKLLGRTEGMEKELQKKEGNAHLKVPTSNKTVGVRYTVTPGDNLKRIAEKEYGDAGKWRDIFEANRDRVSDPNAIYPGQVLVIPQE